MRRLTLLLVLTACQPGASEPARPAPEPEADGGGMSSEPDVSKTTASLASRFFDELRSGDFDGAAGLFHYRPTGPTEEQRQNQRREISEFFSVVIGEMGVPRQPRPTLATNEVLFGGIGSGTPEYWEKQPEPLTLIFEAQFERDGPGFVRLDFSFVNGVIELGSAQFGLASDRPGAAARMQEVMTTAFGHDPQPN